MCFSSSPSAAAVVNPAAAAANKLTDSKQAGGWLTNPVNTMLTARTGGKPNPLSIALSGPGGTATGGLAIPRS